MLNVERKGRDSARIEIYLVSGKKLDIDEKRIMSDGFKVEDAASDSDNFSIGFTSCKVFSLKLLNFDQGFSLEDCTGATVIPYVINNGKEYKKGIYKVHDKQYASGLLELTCYDNVYAMEKSIDIKCFNLPCTYLQAMQFTCEACGLTLGTQKITNGELILSEIDSSITTYRQLAGYIMQCAGSVLKANVEGIITINDYKRIFNEGDNLEGGNLENYNSGDIADGGNFTDYTTGSTFDGGTFGDRSDIEFKYDISDLSVATEDTIITGVAATINDTFYIVGNEGYVLEIANNPLLNVENVNDILSALNNKYAGMRFRKLSGKIRSDFKLESMDPVCVEDYKGNAYDCYLTRITYNIGDYTSITCDCKTPEEASVTGNSTVTKILKMADSTTDKKIEKEKNLREKAIEELTKKLTESSGLYTTKEMAEGGGYIYYTHDKPTLKESTFITKWTSEAIGLSMDGGKTYPYGFTITAKMIMDIVAANKIMADYIYGGTLTLGGQDNTHGVLKMLNSSGEEIGSWNQDGVNAQAGKIGGWSIENGMLKRTVQTYIPPDIKVAETIKNAILAETTKELEKSLYDFNNDGSIDVFDFSFVKRILMGKMTFNNDTCVIAKKSNVTITINPYATDGIISVVGIDMWGQERKTIMGIDDLQIYKIKTENIETGSFWFNKDYYFDGDPYNVLQFGENSKSYLGSLDGTLILGNSQGDELKLQTDGNLVLYNIYGEVVWSSDTAR